MLNVERSTLFWWFNKIIFRFVSN